MAKTSFKIVYEEATGRIVSRLSANTGWVAEEHPGQAVVMVSDLQKDPNLATERIDPATLQVAPKLQAPGSISGPSSITAGDFVLLVLGAGAVGIVESEGLQLSRVEPGGDTYEVEFPDAGSYTIRVQSPGYLDTILPVEVV